MGTPAVIARKIGEGLGKKFTGIDNQDKFQEIFNKDILNKPLILILDEFDALISYLRYGTFSSFTWFIPKALLFYR
jgi:Cdc6-like AAA superfamily ATPase